MPPQRRSTYSSLTLTPSLNTTAMITQQVAGILIIYKANWNNASEQNGDGIATHKNTRDLPKTSTYEEFINHKPKSFHGNEGVIGLGLWTKIWNQYSLSVPMQKIVMLSLKHAPL